MIDLALEEDLGDLGDITTQSLNKDEGRAVLISKDTGILAGSEIFQAVFKRLDPQIDIQFFFKDGQSLEPGDKVSQITGQSRAILTAERTALNFLSFLSGIATRTRLFIETASRYGKAQILDTRKTLPGFRSLSKYAVKVGGGKNHRNGLYDMILIKDNHIDLSGSITRAVEAVQKKWGARFTIEVECRNIGEVKEALASKVDIIMLDNLDLDKIKEAVSIARVHGRTQLEASGGIDLEKIKLLSSTGIDFISVGRITHSIEAFDFSLQIEDKKTM